jgi:hypothetical protein
MQGRELTFARRYITYHLNGLQVGAFFIFWPCYQCDFIQCALEAGKNTKQLVCICCDASRVVISFHIGCKMLFIYTGDLVLLVQACNIHESKSNIAL